MYIITHLIVFVKIQVCFYSKSQKKTTDIRIFQSQSFGNSTLAIQSDVYNLGLGTTWGLCSSSLFQHFCFGLLQHSALNSIIHQLGDIILATQFLFQNLCFKKEYKSVIFFYTAKILRTIVNTATFWTEITTVVFERVECQLGESRKCIAAWRADKGSKQGA